MQKIIDRKLFKCKRCDWEWFSRKKQPKVCAKCHSPYWDTDREKVNK